MTSRMQNLIEKGGDSRIETVKSDIDYDATMKDKLTMGRTDACVPILNKTTDRKVAFGNFYK